VEKPQLLAPSSGHLPRVNPIARCDPLATIRHHPPMGEPHGAIRPARHDPPAPARGLSFMARPDRLPSPSVTCGLDPRIDRFGLHEMPPSERRLRCDRTETACPKSGSGSLTLCWLTCHQPVAPTLSGIRWSRGSWESARPRQKRRQGPPRSRGPAEETLNDQEVNLRLAASRFCSVPGRGTPWPTTASLSRRTGGRSPGVATALGSRR
jgi:hypothetical protein